MPTNITLTKFCVLDKDARKAKFAFKLEHYSTLIKHQMTRSFNFGGNFWKFQVTKCDGHIGMYLRWYGTIRPFGKHTVKCSCTAATRFSVINHFFPDSSISEGISKTADTFEKLGGGIGYSKVAPISEIEKSPGFLHNDTLYLQLFLNVIQTTFHNELSCNLKPEMDHVEGLKFSFYGSYWYLLFYPEGESEKTVRDSREKTRQSNLFLERDTTTDADFTMQDPNETDSGYAGIYLRRETDNIRRSLRHNVQFVIAVDGIAECVLDQHFYSNNNNIYGSATFMKVADIRNGVQSNTLTVKVKFMTIVPYLYYSYGINHKDNSLCEGFTFQDHYKYPWKFKLMENPSTEKGNIQGVVKLDPSMGSKKVKSIAKRGSHLQVCWFVEILCPENILRSLTFMSVGKRPVIDSFFNASGQKDSINFQEAASEVCEDDSPLLDADGNLCVLVSVLCSNLVNKKGSEGTNILDVSICDDVKTNSVVTKE